VIDTPGVRGRCPVCTRTTLILGAGGYVTCAHLDCPNPTAATDLLGQPSDTADYYLLFGDDTASISCRPCQDGIFEHPGDRYWQAFPNGVGLDVLNEAARRHHEQQHTATPEEPTP
jgi:hypothetical protein